MKKLMLLVVLALLLSFPLQGGVKVDWGGLFYLYTFTWMNADFDSDVSDGDMSYYMHADLNATAHFDENTSVFIRLGDWGNFGHHPIYGVGPYGATDWSGYYPPDYLGVHVMAAYVSVQNILDSPIGFTGGIIPVLYGDIAFDGGENGFTGVKLNVATDMFMLDLFSFRAIEAGGMGYMFYGLPGDPGPDLDLHGAWATVKIPDAKIEFNGFLFLEREGSDYAPMWVGARSTGTPMEGLYYVGDFAMMMGSDETFDPAVDFGGMYFSARAKFTVPGVPVTVGGGYYFFSGDDPATDDKDEGYYSPTGGPYPNDFYKGWPGFGPAYTLWSPYGFNLVAPNLTVINANIGYAANHMLNVRGDFFMYSLAEGDPSDMGMEFAVHAWINLSEAFGLGVTGGYWMPGDAFAGEDAMLAGYTYIYKPF